MSRIEAVIFDLDDTLYPERQYVRSGYEAVAGHLRAGLARTEAFEDWLWDRFCGGRRDRALDALNEHFELGLEQENIAELVELYRSHRPEITPFEGTAALLEGLGGRFRLGLLSDGFLPAQRLKLESLGLARYFGAVVFTEELGRDAWKPSPTGFQRISELLAVPADGCAYVADNPAKDFVAPNALGWLTIQCLHPGQIHADNPPAPGGAARIVVRGWRELAATLA